MWVERNRPADANQFGNTRFCLFYPTSLVSFLFLNSNQERKIKVKIWIACLPQQNRILGLATSEKENFLLFILTEHLKMETTEFFILFIFSNHHPNRMVVTLFS
jgi:hypothetical protein